MAVFGLIGRSLAHSFSRKYFTGFFEHHRLPHTYINLETDSLEKIKDIIADRRLSGFNVTIPYKQDMVTFLDEMHDDVRAMSAVNCVDIREGKWIGYNTDVIGFRESMEPFVADCEQACALVLGTGGAAKAVCYVLRQLDIPYLEVSRKPAEGQLAYADLNEQYMRDYRIIINTTPLGTYPNTFGKPDIPYGLLTDRHYLYDLVYNPSETAFMQEGLLRGARVKNGYDMLLIQARASWAIWQRSIPGN